MRWYRTGHFAAGLAGVAGRQMCCAGGAVIHDGDDALLTHPTKLLRSQCRVKLNPMHLTMGPQIILVTTPLPAPWNNTSCGLTRRGVILRSTACERTWYTDYLCQPFGDMWLSVDVERPLEVGGIALF